MIYHRCSVPISACALFDEISENILLQIRAIIEKKEQEIFLNFYKESFSERCPCSLEHLFKEYVVIKFLYY